MRKELPEATVPQEICVSGHPNPLCPYTDEPYQPKMEYVKVKVDSYYED